MAAFTVRIVSTGLGFAVSLFLARVLGATGFGEYAFALAWVSLLTIPATLGTDRLLVREVAVLVHGERWPPLKGLLRASSLGVCGFAVLLSAVAALITHTVVDDLPSKMIAALSIGLFAVPLIATNRARQAVIRGLGAVGPSVIPEAIIHPASLMLGTAGLWLFFGELDSVEATGIYVLSMGAAWIVGVGFLRRLSPASLEKATPTYDLRTWTRGIGPFVLLGGLEVIHNNTDIIMLGFLSSADATGVYRIANRMAALTAFPLAAVSVALAPIIAREYAAENHRKIQQLATTAARAASILAALVLLGLALLAPFVLTILGEAFENGMTPLVILGAAHMLNAVLGVGALILMMTGGEVDAAVGVGLGALLNVALNALMIPLWGPRGAAIATAASLVTIAATLMVQVWRRLGIGTAAVRLTTR